MTWVIWATIFSSSLHGASPEPVLTFPYLAIGPRIEVEVNLANPASQIESGEIRFLDHQGSEMPVLINGKEASSLNFSVPPRSGRKFRISAAGDRTEIQVGYALVFADNLKSSLVGNVVFTLNNVFELSVPNSRPTTSAQIFSERSEGVNTGYALLNPEKKPISIQIVIRDQDGREVAGKSLEEELLPGHMKSGFLSDIMEWSLGESEFIGTLEFSSNSPFHIMGLRQRETLSLAALPAAVNSGPVVGSQLLYYLDTGIDLIKAGHPTEKLESQTVFDLTGFDKPLKPSRLKITNNSRTNAVTLHFYYLNDQGRDYLDFLVVLLCGETLVFDPFDFEIPGTGLRTSHFLFGKDLEGLSPKEAERFRAIHFGTGRFLLSVVAVGAPLDADLKADLLHPNEITNIDMGCGITTRNTGSESGYETKANLHSLNALPIAFDYLSGSFVDPATGREGPSFAADDALKQLSRFTRTRIPIKDGFVLQTPPDASLLDYMAGRQITTAAGSAVPETAIFCWGSEPFTFLAP